MAGFLRVFCQLCCTEGEKQVQTNGLETATGKPKDLLFELNPVFDGSITHPQRVVGTVSTYSCLCLCVYVCVHANSLEAKNCGL